MSNTNERKIITAEELRYGDVFVTELGLEGNIPAQPSWLCLSTIPTDLEADESKMAVTALNTRHLGLVHSGEVAVFFLPHDRRVRVLYHLDDYTTAAMLPPREETKDGRWRPCPVVGPGGARCQLRGEGHASPHEWEECGVKGPHGEICFEVEPIGPPGHPRPSKAGHAGQHSWEG